MPKESTHAKEHWIGLQADEAKVMAIKACKGYSHHSDLLYSIDLDMNDIGDDFRAAVGDKRYYDIARLKALALAAALLRVAAIAHREGTRE